MQQQPRKRRDLPKVTQPTGAQARINPQHPDSAVLAPLGLQCVLLPLPVASKEQTEAEGNQLVAGHTCVMMGLSYIF